MITSDQLLQPRIILIMVWYVGSGGVDTRYNRPSSPSSSDRDNIIGSGHDVGTGGNIGTGQHDNARFNSGRDNVIGVSHGRNIGEYCPNLAVIPWWLILYFNVIFCHRACRMLSSWWEANLYKVEFETNSIVSRKIDITPLLLLLTSVNVCCSQVALVKALRRVGVRVNLAVEARYDVCDCVTHLPQLRPCDWQLLLFNILSWASACCLVQ